MKKEIKQNQLSKNGFIGKVAVIGAAVVAGATNAMAVAIAAPDMTDAMSSVTNVFGAVLGVAVLIFGFKKIREIL